MHGQQDIKKHKI